MEQNSGKVIIFSAPSGSGKSTLVQHCLAQFPNLEFSISCTTRNPRGEEQNGKEYHFLSVEEFQQKISENAFVEYEEVYTNTFYGTLKSEISRIWEQGKTVIFDVDVKGGISLKNYFQNQAKSIFIMPPSVEELEKRLRKRATDSEEIIQMRVAKAEEEISFQSQFDTILINDDLHTAKQEIEHIIENFIL